ncbi:hypothetical protein HanHA300_Chr07g0237961 [Helianthus annuus]|nr:hypothetical protein HanHA300_Chr07g0237961 [Helianthus annuus]KAJ0562740.1 hypothetical protein HanHA89_Chr07g0255131 [Helianthus annuus]KAJ0799197.1 hypothetical protein HanLR1_Chr00c2145g0835471 [Helianthus annuus]
MTHGVIETKVLPTRKKTIKIVDFGRSKEMMMMIIIIHSLKDCQGWSNKE